jgi:hypothetical protein
VRFMKHFNGGTSCKNLGTSGLISFAIGTKGYSSGVKELEASH